MQDALRSTPLHAAHVQAGAKMVPFAGWSMPVSYPPGIVAEHQAVRTDVGVFDVSHMGEVDFHGPGAQAAVMALVTNDVGKLAVGRAQYTVACRPHGGIVDDCIVYRLADEHFRIVVNASNAAKDLAFFLEHASGRCEIVDRSDELALIAVQGPRAVALVAELAKAGLGDTPSFGLATARIAGVELLVARTGYTGEDGFELFVPNLSSEGGARKVWDAVVGAGASPTGLGARDTLRLEARLCLYGNDIDETTDPFEAGLAWVVKLDRGPDAPPCVGHDALVEKKRKGASRRLVGLVVEGRGIVRPDAEVLGPGDEVVGRVTSGGVAPTVGGSIGMAYVPAAMAGEGTELRLRQRGKELTARIVKGPFYRRPA